MAVVGHQWALQEGLQGSRQAGERQRGAREGQVSSSEDGAQCFLGVGARPSWPGIVGSSAQGLFSPDLEHRWGSLCLYPCPRNMAAPGSVHLQGVLGWLVWTMWAPVIWARPGPSPGVLVPLLYGKSHRAGGGNF